MSNETVDFTAVSQPFQRVKLSVYTTLHKVEFTYNGLQHVAMVHTKEHGAVEVKVWRGLGTAWKWSANGRAGMMRTRSAAGYAAVLSLHPVPHTRK